MTIEILVVTDPPYGSCDVCGGMNDPDYKCDDGLRVCSRCDNKDRRDQPRPAVKLVYRTDIRYVQIGENVVNVGLTYDRGADLFRFDLTRDAARDLGKRLLSMEES